MIEKRGKNSWRLTVSEGYDGNGQQIRHRKTVVAVNITEAKKLYNQFAADIQRGNIAKSNKVTLTQFYEFWLDSYARKNHEAATVAYNEQLFKRIKTALGHKKIADIEPKHLLAFYKNLAEPGIKIVQKKKEENRSEEDIPQEENPQCLASSTIKKYHTLLSTLLEKAVKWGFISNNPAKRVEPPKASSAPKTIYEPELLGGFLQALEGEELKHRLWVLLALSEGLRREEIFGLEWSHVALQDKVLSLEQASVYVSGQGTITKAPKNQSSRRKVSISETTADLLKQYKTEQDVWRKKLGNKWIETNRLFTQWNGGIAHPQSFNTWLTRFCDEKNFPHVTPHAFRHMAATYLITKKTDIRTVGGKLGHSKPTTTWNVYSHLVMAAETETAKTMENFLKEAVELAEKAKQNQQKEAAD